MFRQVHNKATDTCDHSVADVAVKTVKMQSLNTFSLQSESTQAHTRRNIFEIKPQTLHQGEFERKRGKNKERIKKRNRAREMGKREKDFERV